MNQYFTLILLNTLFINFLSKNSSHKRVSSPKNHISINSNSKEMINPEKVTTFMRIEKYAESRDKNSPDVNVYREIFTKENDDKATLIRRRSVKSKNAAGVNKNEETIKMDEKQEKEYVNAIHRVMREVDRRLSWLFDIDEKGLKPSAQREKDSFTAWLVDIDDTKGNPRKNKGR